MKIREVLHNETDDVFRNAKPGILSTINHAFGIVFVVPKIREDNEVEEKQRLSDLREVLSKQLDQWVSNEPYIVLRGSYFPDESLTNNHFFDIKKRGRFAYPGVEVLICEKR